VTPHEEFETIAWEALKPETGRLVVVDGRDAIADDAVPDSARAYTIGVGADGDAQGDETGDGETSADGRETEV
jgi:hypothetical protein